MWIEFVCFQERSKNYEKEFWKFSAWNIGHFQGDGPYIKETEEQWRNSVKRREIVWKCV